MRRLGQLVTVFAVVVVSAGIIHAGGTPAQKCAAAKSKAASKKIASKLRCYQKASLAGQPVDSACLTAAETKFSTTIPKIEGKGGCLVTGDANAIEGAVDTCVDNIVTLTPATSTTTTTLFPPCSTGGAACGSTCGGGGICMPLCDPSHGTCTLACLNASSAAGACSGTDAGCAAGSFCSNLLTGCAGCGSGACFGTCP